MDARTRHSLNHLRQTLQAARDAQELERVHLALIDTVAGLITLAEHQASTLGDLQSDTSLDRRAADGAFVGRLPAEHPRDFAFSSNGDSWAIGRDQVSRVAHVVHKANLSSGGAVTLIELGAFLSGNPSAPEVLGLLRLIGRVLG